MLLSILSLSLCQYLHLSMALRGSLCPSVPITLSSSPICLSLPLTLSISITLLLSLSLFYCLYLLVFT